MKCLLPLCFLVLVGLTACDHEPPSIPDCLTESGGFNPDDCPGNGTCSFVFFPDSKLEITQEEKYVSFEVKPGKNLVFHFEYDKHDNPMITDDEYYEHIYFEVKPECNSFVIHEEDLKTACALFGRLCFCPDSGYHFIEQGCIYGYKINDHTWNISLNLTASSGNSSYNRMKQRDFTRTGRPG